MKRLTASLLLLLALTVPVSAGVIHNPSNPIPPGSSPGAAHEPVEDDLADEISDFIEWLLG